MGPILLWVFIGIVIIVVVAIKRFLKSGGDGSKILIILSCVIGFILTLVGIILSRGEITSFGGDGFQHGNDVIKNVLIFIGIVFMALGAIFGVVRYIKKK